MVSFIPKITATSSEPKCIYSFINPFRVLHLDVVLVLLAFMNEHMIPAGRRTKENERGPVCSVTYYYYCSERWMDGYCGYGGRWAGSFVFVGDVSLRTDHSPFQVTRLCKLGDTPVAWRRTGRKRPSQSAKMLHFMNGRFKVAWNVSAPWYLTNQQIREEINTGTLE